MKNENIIIFGDSYSAYKDYVPEGYGIYYPREDGWMVTDASKMWWGMLANETESKIMLNDSWSGSTMCNTGYSGDCSKTNSFIFRLTNHIADGFFEKNSIDRAFILGATNDSWSMNTCGEVMFSGWCEDDLKLILPGISYFVDLLASKVPSEKICFIVNTDLREEITEGIIKICEHYNAEYVLLSDIDKVCNHPTAKGMEQIKDQVLAKLNVN